MKCSAALLGMSTWLSNNEDIRMRFYHPTHSPAPLLNDDHVSVTEDVRVQNTFPESLRALQRSAHLSLVAFERYETTGGRFRP